VENIHSEDKLTSFVFNLTRSSNLYLVTAVIDGKRKVSRKPVFNFDETEVGPEPSGFHELSPDQVAVFGERYKNASKSEEAIGVLSIK